VLGIKNTINIKLTRITYHHHHHPLPVFISTVLKNKPINYYPTTRGGPIK